MIAHTNDSSPAPKKKSGCRRGCMSFGCLPFLALAIFFIGIPTWKAIEGWWTIRSALANAQSVKLVHYNPYSHISMTPGSEIIYGTKDISRAEFSKITWAFPPVPDYGMPSDPWNCTFDPHHKIVITDAAGRQTVIKVCFLCDHVQIGENGEIFCTPFLWRPLLHKFFDDEGLPYTPDRYLQDFQNRMKDVTPSEAK